MTILTLGSTILMLFYTSPEYSWDEADYIASAENPWVFLWKSADYNRHGHGPMDIYLAKLGQELLPGSTGTPELRFRFFEALVSSFAIGLTYWGLRCVFCTSRAGALVGAGLLLFSVIRLEETSIVGPHHLMLLCTLAMVSLGAKWLNSPTPLAGVALGAVLGFGALTMTYVIPVAVCWVLAVAIAGRGWFGWDRRQVTISWSLPIVALTATVVLFVLWPPGVLQQMVLRNFHWYLHYSHTPTLVGSRIFEVTPRWAPLFWLAHLDSPMLVSSCAVIAICLWRTRNRPLQSKHLYLAVWLSFFLGTALVAHIAGARNFLQFIGILCLTTGALFDDVFTWKPASVLIASAVVITLAAANLVWSSHRASYTPSVASSGYRAFLKENKNLLGQNAKALVGNLPALNLYIEETHINPAWKLGGIAWTTHADAPLPAEVQYVLTSTLIDSMPPEQPMRRVVAGHWKLVWSHKEEHTPELRLYENPDMLGH